MALSNFPSPRGRRRHRRVGRTENAVHARRTASKFNLDEYGLRLRLRRSNVQYKDIDAPRRHEMKKKERTNCLFCLPTRPWHGELATNTWRGKDTFVRGARFGTRMHHAEQYGIWSRSEGRSVRLCTTATDCHAADNTMNAVGLVESRLRDIYVPRLAGLPQCGHRSARVWLGAPSSSQPSVARLWIYTKKEGNL